MGPDIQRVVTAAILAMTLAPIAHADPATTAPARVDNPQYPLWAKYRPGSSVTLAGDVDAGQLGRVHLEVTQVLSAVTPDGATVSESTKVLVGGKPMPAGLPRTVPVPARLAASAVTPAGTATVQAMGRAFACHLYDLAAVAVGAPKGTAAFSDDVPGGTVRLVLTGDNGKAMTLLLTATDVK